MDEDEYFVLMGFKDEKRLGLAKDEEVGENRRVSMEASYI